MIDTLTHVTDHSLSRLAQGLTGSEVLKIAGEVRALMAAGRSVANLTVGDFSPTEFRILSFLARNAGRVVTQADLLTKVWGPEYKDEAHLLRVNIARLRGKIEPDPGKPRFIITRPGIGYTLNKLS